VCIGTEEIGGDWGEAGAKEGGGGVGIAGDTAATDKYGNVQTPAANPPAMIAPTSAMNHSGELKPMMATEWNRSRPSLISDLAAA